MKKSKKFRAFVVPRFLPGSVPGVVLVKDLEAYNNHRLKVFNATSKIDTKPPPMNPYNYINARRLADDAYRLRWVDKENQNMIRKINTINRTGGRVDSFNPYAYTRQSKWRSHELKMLRIVQDNKLIYRRIMQTESGYALSKMQKFWSEILEKLKHSAKYPLVVFDKRTIDDDLREQPSISGGLEQTADRPMCYMDFQLKGSVFLGRIIIELYHDYVPVTVQNFRSICCGENNLSYKNAQIYNIVRGQYFELGDITLGNGKGGASIYGNTFAEENYTLRHTKAGVLSMIRVGGKQNSSQFSITLGKMENLDGKRVVFGKIVKGNSVLCKIQDLGRKVGKPSMSIFVSDCGEYKRTKSE